MTSPSTAEVLAGLVEEMTALAAYHRDHTSASNRAAAPGVEDALALVEAALGRHGAGDAAAGEHRTDEEWAVFCGDPDDVEDIVQISHDLCDAEELAQRVIDAHIGRRVVQTVLHPWVVQPRCSSCGSVLDGELCCDGRRAEIEAGEAVLPAVPSSPDHGAPEGDQR